MQVYKAMWATTTAPGSPLYDFYARFGDENYVLPETLTDFLHTDMYEMYGNAGILRALYSSALGKRLNWRGPGVPDFSLPFVVGSIAPHFLGLVGVKSPYLAAGPGWIWSRAALELFVANMDQCVEWMTESNSEHTHCHNWCEDVMISDCLIRLNVQLVPACGAFGWPPEHINNCGITRSQILCHTLTHTHRCPSNNNELIGACPVAVAPPVAFNYMSPEDMRLIDTDWHRTSGCGKAERDSIPIELRSPLPSSTEPPTRAPRPTLPARRDPMERERLLKLKRAGHGMPTQEPDGNFGLG